VRLLRIAVGKALGADAATIPIGGAKGEGLTIKENLKASVTTS